MDKEKKQNSSASMTSILSQRNFAPAWRRYGMAIAFAMAAAIIRLVFMDEMKMQVPFVTFFPAVIFAALYGGLGPGLLSTALSTIIVKYLLLEPVGQLLSDNIADQLGMVIFAFSCVIISLITEAMHRARLRTAEAEAEVREERDRLTGIINSVSDEIWFTDTNKKFTLANPSALAEFGLHSGDVDVEKMASNLEVFRPDGSVRPVEEAPPLRALKGEIVRNEDEIIRTPSHGELRHRQVSSVPVRDANGSIIGSVSVARDITELKAAEAKLRENEERLQAVLQSGSIGTFDVDLLTGETRWNDVEYGLLGLKSSDVSGNPRTFFDYVHPDDLDSLSAKWEEALRTGVLDAEFRIVRADGQERWLAGKGRFGFEGADGGRAFQFLGVNFDITERKQAETALEHERDILQSVMNGAKNSHLVFLDRDFNFVRVNETYAQTCGYLPAEMIGKNHFALYPDRENEAIFARVRDTGKAFEVHDKPFEFPDQPERGVTYWDWTLTPVKDSSNHATGLIFSLFETTGRKMAEDRIQRLNDELVARNEDLEVANKEMESFIYSVSHDLRGPLRAISGFSSLLTENSAGDPDDKKKDYLDRIRLGAARMNQLINDLLRLSHVARQEMTRTVVDLSGLAANIVRELKETCPDRKVNVEIGTDISGFADSGLINIVLSNLLDNAWKFTSGKENARIEFTAIQGLVPDRRKITGTPPASGTESESPAARATIYCVKDNGAGFKQEYADKMFLPFHRLHGNDEFEGTGIGLAIVERIIRRHGGIIWAEGQEDRGSAVYFTLG
jgi:PAS domain S-box-containing protein